MTAPEAPPLATVRDLLRERAAEERIALRFEGQRWSWREHVQLSLDRAAWLLAERETLAAGAPFHVGILLENVPEYSFLLGAAAFAGACVVGINPTRRGAELARDIRHSDCTWIVTEARHLPLLEGLDCGVPPERIRVIDTPAWAAALAPHEGAPDPDVALDPLAPYLLIFTSGTTGQPKAAICSQRRLAWIGGNVCTNRGVTLDDVCYQVMPMFHSNQLMAGWVPALHCGATLAMRRRFSASGFLPDVRKYGITFFNYVGKPLSYILATPELPDDADNPLKIAFGNEAAPHDLERFAKRFGCQVLDAYGSTEGSVTIGRVTRGGACRTPTPASGRSRTARARPASKATTGTTRRTRRACATASTGPGTSAIGTLRASSTSRAGTSTGCAWTARTLQRLPSSRSSRATRPSRSRPSMRSPTPKSATR